MKAKASSAGASVFDFWGPLWSSGLQGTSPNLLSVTHTACLVGSGELRCTPAPVLYNSNMVVLSLYWGCTLHQWPLLVSLQGDWRPATQRPASAALHNSPMPSKPSLPGDIINLVKLCLNYEVGCWIPYNFFIFFLLDSARYSQLSVRLRNTLWTWQRWSLKQKFSLLY